MKKLILYCMYLLIVANTGILIYFITLPRQHLLTKRRSIPVTPAAAPAKEPVVQIETSAAIITTALPAASNVTEKKAMAAPARATATTPEVAPPDESDASPLTSAKPGRRPVKKTVSPDDDILRDDAAGNGFNTGIKKDSPRHKP